MFILGSGSPRRQELLKQIGCSFSVAVSNADEVMKDELCPQDLVLKNACAKAVDVAQRNPGCFVLGADTVVSIDGHVLGKPTDAADAVRMLTMLSGRTHHVSTGIAFAQNTEVFSDVVTTEVTFGEMSQEDISNYVATGEPLDKAGAYGIQGRAAAFISGMKGSYSNVVGLPLYNVRKLAEIAGVDLYGNGTGASRKRQTT